MDPLVELLKIAIPFLLGGLGTWLAQRLKPAPEKQKEQTSANRLDWELWRDQWGWAKTELADLRKQCDDLERRHAELLVKHADLEQRQDDVQEHVEDLYRAIGQEPDQGAAIKSRLKTQRPAARSRTVKIKREVEVSERTATAT